MNCLLEILIMPVNTVFDCVNPLLSCLSEAFSFSASAGSLAIAAGTVAVKNISEGLRSSIRLWRGGITDRFNNIDTPVNTVRENTGDVENAVRSVYAAHCLAQPQVFACFTIMYIFASF